jgi:hypothetical protein
MSHAKSPPTLPTIVDEAADTPSWVPALGLALFALLTMVIAVRIAWNDSREPPVQEQPAVEPAAAPAVATG